MKALILANGEAPSAGLAQRLSQIHDIVIAVDGAIHKASALGIRPDILTGDFDSLRLEVVHTEYPEMRNIETPDQERSDLEKAVDVAIGFGASHLTIIGAAGGRLDHALANTALLLRDDASICLSDDFGETRALKCVSGMPGSLTLETRPGDTVSLITFESLTRVDITGVQWTLQDAHLCPGTQGVSNVAASEHVIITVRAGVVFVCHFKASAVAAHSALPE